LTNTEIYYDPFDAEIDTDPYLIYRRMREERPLYYNDRFEFYALSRFADVERCYGDPKTYISGKGNVLEMIKAGGPAIQAGVIVHEDPPAHDLHRGLLTRVFTPRRVAELEPKVREFSKRCLDPFAGSSGFDFVKDVGALVPMWTIGMLIGIPESDQIEIRDRIVAHQEIDNATNPDYVPSYDQTIFNMIGEYVDWRIKHPADDLMTDLIQAEFKGENGKTCRLTRDEVLGYTWIVTVGGDETTTRLISWLGKLLAEHPDQRRELEGDRDLIKGAVEETLRYEPPVKLLARYVATGVQHYGQKIPEGSAIVLLNGSANRDETYFPGGEDFDVHRRNKHRMMTFGYGIHFCLGAALARLEGRVVVDEVLNRFPEWEIDLDNAVRTRESTLRGWRSLPATVR
jgi:cytochrome P450